MGNVAADVAGNMGDVACCPYVIPGEATGNIGGGNPGNKPFPYVATPSCVAGGGNMESCQLLPSDVATHCGGCGAVVNPSWPSCFACGEPREPTVPRVTCNPQQMPSVPPTARVTQSRGTARATAPDTAPPCERRTSCDLADQHTRHCADHCRPAWEREATRRRPAALDPVRNSRGKENATTRPSWTAEVDTWPEDYRREYPVLVESYRRAGHPRGIAEYGAFLDLEEDARRFAREVER